MFNIISKASVAAAVQVEAATPLTYTLVEPSSAFKNKQLVAPLPPEECPVVPTFVPFNTAVPLSVWS